MLSSSGTKRTAALAAMRLRVGRDLGVDGVVLHVDARAARRSWARAAASRGEQQQAGRQRPAAASAEFTKHERLVLPESLERWRRRAAAPRRPASAPAWPRTSARPAFIRVARACVRQQPARLARRCARRSSGSASARGPPRARQSGSPWNKTAPRTSSFPDHPAAARHLVKRHHRGAQQRRFHRHRSAGGQRQIGVRHGVPAFSFDHPNRRVRRAAPEKTPAPVVAEAGRTKFTACSR